MENHLGSFDVMIIALTFMESMGMPFKKLENRAISFSTLTFRAPAVMAKRRKKSVNRKYFTNMAPLESRGHRSDGNLIFFV